jgi:hypothetical protein
MDPHRLHYWGNALIIGAVDPLECSIVILIGSALIALTTYLSRDRHWKIFAINFIAIIFGVSFMFFYHHWEDLVVIPLFPGGGAPLSFPIPLLG